MGKQPSTIIIARHGARLDQADRNWLAKAERPYDPPLSYGGWIQCQNLGARISRELQALDDQKTRDDLEREDHHEKPRPHKRRKVIIHSSPYLRCIQTSTAIAAGLRYPQQATQDRTRPVLAPLQRSTLSRPPLSPDGQQTPSGSNGAIPRSEPAVSHAEPDKDHYDLRIDPYLGEWLSTSYFEDMGRAHPPPSAELVEQAKQVFQHPAEEIKGAELATPTVSESPLDTKDEIFELHKSGLKAMAAIGHALPHRTRHISIGQDIPNGRQNVQEAAKRARSYTYSPPIPTYSLAPHDPIPIGYFAHARDACINLDTAWDGVEMGCGDGGTYPEEWSAMHRRLRNGLQRMMTYYEDYSSTTDTHTHSDSKTNSTIDDESEDEDSTDLILILVTHQAGANALIRLLTGAPALHDIGTASLTLAVRRPCSTLNLHRTPSLTNTSHSPLGLGRISTSASTRRGSLDLGLSTCYEMRIIASTEHLRAGSNPLGLNSPRLGKSPAFASRRLAGPESIEGFSIGDPLSWRSSSAGTTARRLSQRSYATGDSSRQTTSSASGGSGLWGSPSVAPVREVSMAAEALEDLEPMSPKSRPVSPVGGEREKVPELSELSKPAAAGGERARSSTLHGVDTGTGLWGSAGNANVGVSTSQGTWLNNAPATGRAGSIARARSPKRRWTAMENSP